MYIVTITHVLANAAAILNPWFAMCANVLIKKTVIKTSFPRLIFKTPFIYHAAPPKNISFYFDMYNSKRKIQ